MKSTNPFATRFFQPGAIEYAFLSHGCWGRIVDNALEGGLCKLIVGPHGSGKSTFVKSLIPKLTERLSGGQVHLVQLSSDGTAGQVVRRDMPHWRAYQGVIIDGIEQLTWFRRWLVMRHCRHYKLPLLATSHRVFRGCQVLWETRIDSQTERWVLEMILADYGPEVVENAIQSDAWKSSRARHGNNLRETLFDMYDWWSVVDRSVDQNK